MGFLDRLFGTKRSTQPPENPLVSADQQAIQRYRYLLRTAPADAIERAHAEAFGRLTPEQRVQIWHGLSETLPASERASAQVDPEELARLATRTELRHPGTLERLFGRE